MKGETGSYLGSKGQSGTWQMIINNMPPHRVFVDAFTGSGVIPLKKQASEITYINDLDDAQVSKVGHLLMAKDKGARSRCMDALELFQSIQHLTEKFTRDTLIYCDPPYLSSTRTSNSRYKYEYSTDQHVQLLEYLLTIDANVMISGYPSSLYDSLLDNRDWKTIEFQSMTRGGVRTEKLWMNYELDSVFDTRFVGKDCTERQQIKRKAERWQEKYKKMPTYEQQAILQALLEVHRD